ncbi:hypothetical protein [Hymenobacter wooponensis]|uniref:Uncharacterized protein n=1 Tax=Hymenobacter wooponensis TaxID=1525360 RepID=A0A4Z0MDN5_9BACT|nr:hypothetical protein [Hymenobacter wooponensis]TGD77626.1 hypothetical protein EU557_22895 [Hymenobacter wooponensis]
MNTPPKRNFTAKTARPTIDTSALYGMDEVAVPSPPPAEPAAEPAPPAAAEDAGLEWVQFSTYLRRNTYLRLKQAEYWEPGFVVRQQIEQVVSELLDKLENANRSLPDEHLRKLLEKNKKLRS